MCVSIGTKDPRLNQFGIMNFRLSRQLNAYQHGDLLPDHVKPIPFQVILYLTTTAFAGGAAAEGTKAIADMVNHATSQAASSVQFTKLVNCCICTPYIILVLLVMSSKLF